MSRKEVLKKTLGKKRAKKYIPAKEKVTLDIGPECIEGIVRAELSSTVRSLTEDLKKRKEGVGVGIFESDLAKDIALLRLHIHCFKTVLKYYGEP